MADPSFVASFFTGDEVSYIGASAPRLGVFVIDTNGPPRLAVGPVARAYETRGPVARRLSDADGYKLADKDRFEPWAKSYTAPDIAAPSFGVRVEEDTVTIETKVAVGNVTVEPLDHHRASAGPAVTKRVVAGATTFAITRKDAEYASSVRVTAGDFHAWVGWGESEFGSFKFPPKPPPPEEP